MNKVQRVKLTAYVTPEGRESKTDKLIRWGVDNAYPDFLLELFDKSATHGAIVKGKVDYIVGRGVVNSDGNTAQWKPNRYMNAEEFLRRLAMDLEVFGGYAIQVIKRQDMRGVSEVYALPFQYLRKGKDDTILYYSEEWKKQPKQYQTMKRYYTGIQEESSVIYVSMYTSGNSQYPKPEYSQGISAIQTDKEIANFHLNNIANGFSAGTLISFNNGIPEVDEQDEIVAQIKGQHAGTDNAGEIVVVFSDGQDRAPTLLDLKGNDLDKKFDQLKQGTQEQIFIAHRVVSPMLFSVRTAGQLGGRSEILEAYEMFKKTYIEPKQRKLLDTLQYCSMLMGNSEVFKILELTPIDNEIPISDAAVSSSLNIDELRGIISDRYNIELKQPDVEAKGIDYEKKAAQSALRGTVGGITGIIEIVTQVNSGTIPANAAKEILIDLYGFDEATAIKILAKTDEGATIQQRFVNKLKCNHGKSDPTDTVLLEKFALLGESEDEFEVLHEMDVDITTRQIRVKQAELSDLGNKVLGAITENPKITAVTIAEALGESLENVVSELDKLSQYGYIRASDAGFESTSAGTKVSDAIKGGIEIQTRYRYAWADGFSDADLSSSREFCQTMLGSRKLYSRQDIDSIENDLGTDVWATRGGWYHDPERDVNLPYCRHVWKQVIVTKKK